MVTSIWELCILYVKRILIHLDIYFDMNPCIMYAVHVECTYNLFCCSIV